MKLLDLNGSWAMTDLGSERSLTASVPGTVAATLVEHQVMPDPYWRENESIVQPVFEALRQNLVVRSLNDIMIDAAESSGDGSLQSAQLGSRTS
jgi:glycosyl hydrolase family 2